MAAPLFDARSPQFVTLLDTCPIVPGATVSKPLLNIPEGKVVIFAMDVGQEISEPLSPLASCWSCSSTTENKSGRSTVVAAMAMNSRSPAGPRAPHSSRRPLRTILTLRPARAFCQDAAEFAFSCRVQSTRLIMSFWMCCLVSASVSVPSASNLFEAFPIMTSGWFTGNMLRNTIICRRWYCARAVPSEPTETPMIAAGLPPRRSLRRAGKPNRWHS